MTGTTATVSAPAVELTATITPASSTAQIFASPTFYGVDFTQIYGDQQIVPFFLGPQGIINAIHDHQNEDNVVLSSGWGAGQTGTALAIMRDSGDPALNSVKLVVLDNNTNRAGGGFWTTYSIFAPLLLTSSAPTPNDLNVPVLDVGYDYNINGNAATYPINFLADVNSLVAYLYGYADQSTVELPSAVAGKLRNNPDQLQPGIHYVVAPDGTVTPHPATGNITYVTFKSDRLPLVRPLLLIPGGKIVADAIEPVLTVLVDAGYKDNQPIPDDPGVPRPMGLFPVKETVTALQRLPGAVAEGVHNVRDDLSSGDVFSTSNQPNTATTVNTFASNSSARSLPQVTNPSTSSSTNPFNIPNAFKPGRKNPTSNSSSGNTKNPVRQVVSGVEQALTDLADSVTNVGKKPSSTTSPSGQPIHRNCAGELGQEPRDVGREPVT